MQPTPLPIALALALSAATGSQDPSASSQPLASVAPSSASPWSASPRTQLLWADFDGDGREDLLVLSGGSCSLFTNAGARAWPDHTHALGAAADGVAAASWVDFDGDGWSDLYQITTSGRARLLRNVAGAAFDDVTASAGLDGLQVQGAEWRDRDGDGLPDLLVHGASELRYYQNQGDGRFASNVLPMPAAPVRGSSGPASSWSTPAGPAPQVRTLPDAVPGAVRGSETTKGNASTSLGTLGLPTPSGPRLDLGPVQLGCAQSLLDTSTLSCVSASSVPQLGSLYPLSIDFNLNNDRVGIGTTSPLAKLHVDALGETALWAESGRIAARFDTTSTSDPALDVRSGGNLAAFFDGALEVGGFLAGFGVRLPRVVLDTEGTSPRGVVEVRNPNGVGTAWLRGGTATLDGGELQLMEAGGSPTLIASGGGIGGVLNMLTSSGLPTVQLEAADAPGEGARLALLKNNGQVSIVLDADQGGNGRITTQILEITGGADLAESFEVRGAPEPGSVLVIDPKRPGALALSQEAYDRRVAGVISGAGGVRPGLRLGQDEVLQGSTPVALTGRVWVRCTNEGGPIRPGDLLTSSSTAGCAMAATDPARAFGAVLGKALTALDDDSGLVLVLVGLQ